MRSTPRKDVPRPKLRAQAEQKTYDSSTHVTAARLLSPVTDLPRRAPSLSSPANGLLTQFALFFAVANC